MTPRTACLALALLLVATVAPVRAAQDQVEPDRPDVTNGTKTVPPGAWQIEAGIEYSRTSEAATATERRFLVDTLGRAGVTERLELQVGWQPLVHLRGDEDDTGFGDVTLAAKYRFFDGGSAWPALGVRPFVKLPAAAEPIGSGRADFGALALATFDLPAGFGLDVNAGIAAIGQSRPSGHLLQALTSASLSAEIGAATPFIEFFFASRGERDARDALGAVTGVVYRVTKRLALDAAVQTSLGGVGPDWALRAGVTLLFGR